MVISLALLALTAEEARFEPVLRVVRLLPPALQSNTATLVVFLGSLVLHVAALQLAALHISRMLLRSTCWLTDPRSRSTQIWGLCVKLMGGIVGTPGLWTFQRSLPRLPVPALADTHERFLASVRPLLSPEEYDATVAAWKDFAASPLAAKLQQQLEARAARETNWLTEWWEKYIYLAGRGSLYGSNYIMLDMAAIPPLAAPAIRAAYLIFSHMEFYAATLDARLPVTRLRDTVPLCMHGCKRILGVTRVPGEVRDWVGGGGETFGTDRS